MRRYWRHRDVERDVLADIRILGPSIIGAVGSFHIRDGSICDAMG